MRSLLSWVRPALFATMATALASCGRAEGESVKVGVSLAMTGPAAVLGQSARKAMDLYPATIAGVKIDYRILDDASDTTHAVTNAKKLLTEDNVDVILGPSTTPQSLAIIDSVAEAGVPLIAFGSATRIVEPMDSKRHWVFKVPPNDAVWVGGIVRHMAASGVKTVGFIGFSDTLGDSWAFELGRTAREHNIKVTTEERFGSADTSVLSQALRLTMSNPDAILVVATGSPAALPVITLREHGYKGKIYLNVAGATREFMQLTSGRSEGALLTVAIGQVWEQLPDSNPLKDINRQFVKMYERTNGDGSSNFFALQAYDGARILERAVPVALSKAHPGTQQFRAALRDAIEGVRELPASDGVFNFSTADHGGLDGRAVVMVEIRKGTFKCIDCSGASH